MVTMQLPVWISIWITLIGKGQANSVTACYGTNPLYNSFNMTCDEHKRIRITGAEYRYSNSSPTFDQICELNVSDCKADYSYKHAVILYNRCSGRNNCTNILVPRPTDHECKNYTKLYAHVTYECINDTNIIDMCQAAVRQTSEVNIMFSTGNTLSDPIICSCYVDKTTMVIYQLVDVRLFTNVSNTEGTYDCVESTFQAGNKSFDCKNSNENSFIYLNSLDFDGEIQDLKQQTKILELSNTRKGRPDMVWVHLKADSKRNGKFDIQCQKYPSTPTTEIISTPEGKTSTVIVSFSSVEVANNISTINAASNTSSTFLQAMTTTASDEPPLGGKHQDSNIGGNSLPIIVGVVVASIIMIAIVSVALLLLQRRHRKSKEEDCPKSEPLNRLSNRSYECIDETGQRNAVVETSNYDSITDDSVATYIPPVNEKKDDSIINEDATKHGGNISADEYDMIEFDKKLAKKVPNYDLLLEMGGKIRDDTYSHVSNQAEFVHSSTDTVGGYYHCALNNKETQNNCDDYSRVDLEGDWKTHKQPNANEESLYNHIASENTERLPKGKREIEIGKGPTMFQARNNGEPLNMPCQGIISESLGNNDIDIKQTDLYVKPKSKHQQYTAVIKVQKGKAYDGTDNSNIETLRLDENDNAAQDTLNKSDYQLAKPIYP